MSNTTLETLREKLSSVLKYGLAPTPEGATEQGFSYLDTLIKLFESEIQERVKEATMNELRSLRKNAANHTHQIGNGIISNSYVSVIEIDVRIAELTKEEGKV